jgi:hypothetical protein
MNKVMKKIKIFNETAIENTPETRVINHVLTVVSELEELKRNVNEFMKLLNRYHANNHPLSKQAKQRYEELWDIMEKVGKEE